MIGTTISHYRILEELGRGGMGVVYKASDTRLNRFVAIKVLPPDKVADLTSRSRFEREAKAVAAVSHANIVTIHEIDIFNELLFIVMEYVDGTPLRRLLANERLAVGQALRYSLDVAEALAHAHDRGVVHRDIKPENIMIATDGVAKVLDFGLAKLIKINPSDGTTTENVSTQPGAFLGTALYMSPEQAECKPVDERSDVFSFGVVLYEMLTGTRPFQTPAAVLKESPRPPNALRWDVEEDVCRLVARCLEKEREQRYASGRELRDALQLILNTRASAEVLVRFMARHAAKQKPAVGQCRANPRDGQRYVWVPPGTFRMGCSAGDNGCSNSEKPAHAVSITKGFWMGQTPVTQRAYQRIMGTNPSRFQDESLPVDSVTWEEAKRYCDAVGMRLPTEAEWEWAARGGTTGRTYASLDEIAWHNRNSTSSAKRPAPGAEAAAQAAGVPSLGSRLMSPLLSQSAYARGWYTASGTFGRTHAVSQKQPNDYGLYDMLGNVWEWVADWYGPYQANEQIDPQGPTVGESRVMRGGSCIDFPEWIRVSARIWFDPTVRGFTGFRCVSEAIE